MMYLWEEATMALLACFRIKEIAQIQVKQGKTKLIMSKKGKQLSRFVLDCNSTARHTAKETLTYPVLASTKMLQLLQAMKYNNGPDNKRNYHEISYYGYSLAGANGICTKHFTLVLMCKQK